MSQLPPEIIYQILNYVSIKNLIKFRIVSKLFNDYFIHKFNCVTKCFVVHDAFRKYKYILYVNNETFYVDNFNILFAFNNLTSLSFNFLNDEDETCKVLNNFFSKYNSQSIKKLSISLSSSNFNWQQLTKFCNITHLSLSVHMFYTVNDPKPSYYFFPVRCTYVDGSINDSVSKIIKTFKDTKLYYLCIYNYDHSWSGCSKIFLVKSKTHKNEIDRIKKKYFGCRSFVCDLVLISKLK